MGLVENAALLPLEDRARHEGISVAFPREDDAVFDPWGVEFAFGLHDG